MVRAIIKTLILTLIGAALLDLSSVGGNSVLAVESASMSSSGADFEITPTSANPNGTVAVGEDRLTISSTCSSGYTLYMSSAEDETALKDADNAENTIPSTSGSISEPTILNSPNHWGFALTSSGIGTLTGTGFNESSITSSSKFAGIPSSNRPFAIREKNSGSTDSDEISVYYAANAGTNLAPGNYSGSVLYTLVTPASCGYTLSFQADEENKDSAGNPLIGTVQSAGLTNEFKDPGSTINLNDYRAQYKDGSGNTLDLTEGNTLPSDSTLTRGFYLEGYTQTGWTVKELDSLTNDVLATNTYAINASSAAKTNSSADLVIVSPIWTINRYTISANTSTGIAGTTVNISTGTDANVNNSNINFGSTVSIKYTLTAGYAFSEWQITSIGTNQSGNPFLTKDDMIVSSGSDSAGTSVYTFTMPASNVSLTAKAEGIKYNISFNNNTGSGTMNTIEVTYGDSATLPTNTFTAPEHYEFYGWSTSAQTPTYEYADGIRKYTNGQTGVFNLTTTAGATVPLYALWIGKANTVTITKGDNVTNTTLGTNTTTNTSNSASYRYGQTVNINATIPTGYAWSEWTINSPSGLVLVNGMATARNSFTMSDSAVAITANASIKNFTVNVSGGYVGTSGTITSVTCTYGDTINIRANISTGYHFTSWSSSKGGEFGSNTAADTVYKCNTNIANGTTITLTRGQSANTYTIEYNANSGSGMVPSSQSIAYGSSITLQSRNTLSRSGYNYAGWNIGQSGSSTSAAYIENQRGVSVSELASNAGVVEIDGAKINLYAVWRSSSPITTTMQAFRSDECSNLIASTTANYSESSTYTTRTDNRNKVNYIIRKYADGKCWMTENLRVTPGSKIPTAAVTSGTLTTTTVNSQGAGKVTFASDLGLDDTIAMARYDTSNGSVSVNTAYYNWAAALIVCPSGWVLPTLAEWNSFLNSEGIEKNYGSAQKIKGAPYYFITTGYYNGSTFYNSYAYYWYATEYSYERAYSTYISDLFVGHNSTYKYWGLAVRCVHI